MCVCAAGRAPTGCRRTCACAMLQAVPLLTAAVRAAGRAPKTSGLGLDSVGVALGKKGEVVVDEYLRTSVPSIWALGDVIDKIQLTPVALMEGEGGGGVIRYSFYWWRFSPPPLPPTLFPPPPTPLRHGPGQDPGPGSALKARLHCGGLGCVLAPLFGDSGE